MISNQFEDLLLACLTPHIIHKTYIHNFFFKLKRPYLANHVPHLKTVKSDGRKYTRTGYKY